jgi:hypothetical protein
MEEFERRDVSQDDRLKAHEKFAKEQGWCHQCQQPYCKGVCTCGHHSEPCVNEAQALYKTLGEEELERMKEWVRQRNKRV